MDAFFAKYEGFEFRHQRSIIDEFDRLCVCRGWSETGRTRKKAIGAFRTAMVEEFNAKFGTDSRDLEGWKRLCSMCGIEEIPQSITQCRKIIKKTHVNLVDLIEPGLSVVKVFHNVTALKNYTHSTRRYFPKNHAKQGGLLRHLLRDISIDGPGMGLESYKE